VALLGPRQCGKTTLAREIAKETKSHFVDLEDPADLACLSNPKMFLGRLDGLVIIDEIQLRPDLFPVLRVLLDRENVSTKFMILGSASPHIVSSTSETLAGRVEFVDMRGFSLEEVASKRDAPLVERLWLRGGFPPSFLAENDDDSMAWRINYSRTFIERDLQRFAIDAPPETMRRLMLMLCHLHAQTWNASKLSSSIGLSVPTVKKYLDILIGSYLIRRLPPWFENIGKRLVKSPKIYYRDSGLLHATMGIKTFDDLQGHPIYGSSWEGFALEEVAGKLDERDIFFWKTQAGAELDMLAVKGNRKTGFEFKASESPSTSKSMRIAIENLELDNLYVIHPGDNTFPLDEKITAIPLRKLPSADIMEEAVANGINLLDAIA
jgi:predicted AAA+ superfamily ATPase